MVDTCLANIQRFINVSDKMKLAVAAFIFSLPFNQPSKELFGFYPAISVVFKISSRQPNQNNFPVDGHLEIGFTLLIRSGCIFSSPTTLQATISYPAMRHNNMKHILWLMV